MFCSHCGKQLRDDALMCSNCGALTKNMQNSTGSTPQESIREREPEGEYYSQTEYDNAYAAEQMPMWQTQPNQPIPQPSNFSTPNMFRIPGLPPTPNAYAHDLTAEELAELHGEYAGDYGIGNVVKSIDVQEPRKVRRHREPRKKLEGTKNPAIIVGILLSAIGFFCGFIFISALLAKRGGEGFLTGSLAIVHITLLPALFGMVFSIFGICQKDRKPIDKILFIVSIILSGLLLFYYFIALCAAV